jgi:serine/threonine-protein kinase
MIARQESFAEINEDFTSGVLRRGAQLGRYELVLPVAVGGMARVWAARMYGQRGFSKLVAIKTILPQLARDAELEQMFLEEARIASGVHHPNVCEIYELGEERGVLYLAMEWVSGESLARILGGGRGALDPRIAARIVADACAGLHAAHDQHDEDGNPLQVVHRDVAPHNILISSDGNVKVTDFGVAKALGRAQDLTAAGQLKGRIAYMAPEQATGGSVDRRSDLFALGSVLYEATTGMQAFRGESEPAVLRELLRGQVTPPSRIVRGFPYELERIILRAMAPQPLHRYPTMDGMRLALEEWLAKSGPVVTQSHVAAVVRERVGAEIEKRKERIRLASDPQGDGQRISWTPSDDRRSSAPPPPPRISSPPPLPHRETTGPIALSAGPRSTHPPATPLQYCLAASVGVMAAGLLAIAGVFAYRTVTLAPVAAAPLPVAAVAAAAAAPAPPPVVVVAPPPPPVSASASASAAPAPEETEAPAPVALRVATPETPPSVGPIAAKAGGAVSAPVTKAPRGAPEPLPANPY